MMVFLLKKCCCNGYADISRLIAIVLHNSDRQAPPLLLHDHTCDIIAIPGRLPVDTVGYYM
jgi:hypothetical protein